MKKLLLAGLLAGTAMMMPPVSCAEDAESGTAAVYCLKAVHTDGSEVTVPFTQRPVIVHSGTSLVLTSSELEMEYPDGTLDYFTIVTENTPGGIDRKRDEAKDSKVIVSADKITFTGGKPGAILTVAGIDGSIMLSTRLDSDGHASVPFTPDRGGIYVINSGNTTFKIIKK